jgi:hypothetical protein
MSPPSSNVGGIGGLFKNIKDTISSPEKAVRAASGLLGGTAGAVASVLALPGSSSYGGAKQTDFNRAISENRFRNPATIAPTDTGRGLANLPQGYARDELLLAANANGSSGLRNYGTNYKGKELTAGQAAENFRTGAGFSGQSPAAERAYQAERSSVAQQAKQNPDLQRYQDQAELARQALQGYDPASGPLPGAAQTAQDMGMAMWAKKYGPGSKNDLASKVRPGQSGFGAIQNTLAGSVANTGFQLPTQLSFTPPPSVTPTPFPMEALQSGFQVPGAPITDLLSNYPGFDPNNVDIKLFSKFMQANPKK